MEELSLCTDNVVVVDLLLNVAYTGSGDVGLPAQAVKAKNGKYATLRSRQFWGQKGLGPFEKPREMPHYMFCPRKKNNIPDFQNQRYIKGTVAPV
jgi:hypothetical protein